MRAAAPAGILAAAAAALALLAAGCGGSPASTSSASAGPPGWLAFSACMRSHGVPRYPDPAGGGQAPPKESLQQLGVGSTQFRRAQTACRRLLPNGGRPPSQAQRQQARALSLSFARCMRAHGVPSFPDPDSSGRIPDPAGVGIDQGSPRFEAANTACARYRPPYLPSNAAYNAWARAHRS